MSTWADGARAQARHTVTRKVAALSLGLVALTGLGLLGQGTDQDWVVFAGASLLGVVAWTAAVRQAIGGGAEPAQADVTEPLPPRVIASTAPIDATAGENPDGIDYLMALRHELRTPLNAVLGFSDVLLSGIDGEINDSQREDLEIIRASGIKLRVLLDSALDLSQLATGMLRADIESIDVRDSVARVVSEATQLWASKREASCLVPEEPCLIEVDESRLRRCILVLADLLATDHREAAIEVRLARSEDHVAVSVTAEPSAGRTLEALPTPAEVLGAEDASKIRRWPVAVTSEVIALHGGSLYHGDSPSRFLIRLPLGGAS